MRLDEMIIKANADGKTYTNSEGDITYSKNVGFLDCDGETLYPSCSLLFEGWQELTKRHLTVSEAEKELDCEIDTPDISKLFRPMSEHPGDSRAVIIVYKTYGINSDLIGFYHVTDNCWRWLFGGNHRICYNDSVHWIDPADLIKLLPKE